MNTPSKFEDLERISQLEQELESTISLTQEERKYLLNWVELNVRVTERTLKGMPETRWPNDLIRQIKGLPSHHEMYKCKLQFYTDLLEKLTGD